MKKDLQDYIARLKEETLDTATVKDTMLRIKSVLDLNFSNCERDIQDGDCTKVQLVEEYKEEIEKEGKEDPTFETRLMLLMTEYDACKELCRLEGKKRIELNALMNEAKKKMTKIGAAPLYNTIHLEETKMTTIIVTMRELQRQKMFRGEKDYNKVSADELLEAIHKTKEYKEAEIKDMLISSLQKRIRFLDEYGYIDDYIEKNNDALEDAGLPELKRVRLNPIADEEYDENRQRVYREETEDIGVIDVFRIDNLKKLPLEDLLVLETFWKSKYFTERMKLTEAMIAIDSLGLWPIFMEEDEKAINSIDDKRISDALKKDLALTYLAQNKDIITPEMEKKYIEFLEQTHMVQTETTAEEMEKQSKYLKTSYALTRDLILGHCMILDKLKNKELNVKNWGTVNLEEFVELADVQNTQAFAVEMPSFRGTFVFALEEDRIEEYFAERDYGSFFKKINFPKFRGRIDENYGRAMALMLLPTSKHFVNYLKAKYEEDPSQELVAELATNIAGIKKIKSGKIRSERTK